MFRLIALFIVLPMMAAAQCVGPSFVDDLGAEDRAALNARAAATPFGTGLEWTAQRDGVTVTIVGTMHLPDPRHEVLRAVMRRPLMEADLLLVEATLEDQTDLQRYMADNPDLLAITSGPTLPERLDEATWNAIRQAAADRSIPGFMAAKMQPWFLTMTLALPPCAMMAMAQGEAGLDTLLMQDAADLGVPTAPLEPWQDTFALLSGGTFDEQVAALQMALIDADDQNALIVALTEFYFAGMTAHSWHIAGFTHQLLPDDIDKATFDAQMAQMEQDLLVTRNRNWIPVIEAAAAEHDRIVAAFGAAHLIGQNGVLALLGQNGWVVTPRDSF